MRSCPEKARCHLCGLVSHLMAACTDREEFIETNVSESSEEEEEEEELDDNFSLHSFGENDSNRDGESQANMGDSSKSLIIDETPQSENVQSDSHDKLKENRLSRLLLILSTRQHQRHRMQKGLQTIAQTWSSYFFLLTLV